MRALSERSRRAKDLGSLTSGTALLGCYQAIYLVGSYHPRYASLGLVDTLATLERLYGTALRIDGASLMSRPTSTSSSQSAATRSFWDPLGIFAR